MPTMAIACRIVQFYNGIQYSEIFTLAVYVVRRFEGPDASEQRIGQLAGLLVSHHIAGMILTISIYTHAALASVLILCLLISVC